ncbi:MAG: serine--tRNA ligase, partial [Alphaproteobacteria bacterium]|nr:serine--tRNA ligase [Alphaproteobacteria bacterium]
MHDLRWIRENPGAFDNALARRGINAAAQKILKMDEKWRHFQTVVQAIQEKRNATSTDTGAAIADGRADAADALKIQGGKLKGKMQEAEEGERKTAATLNEMLMELPNILDKDVPDGEDEDANKELRQVGDVPKFEFEPRPHFELGEALGLMDFEVAGKISGARFVILK